MQQILNLLAAIGWAIRRAVGWVACFFVGHDVRYGDDMVYEPDWCDRCFIEYPQDYSGVLPCYLNRLYGGLVERDWRWFNALDAWLGKKCGSRGPEWWSY